MHNLFGVVDSVFCDRHFLLLVFVDDGPGLENVFVTPLDQLVLDCFLEFSDLPVQAAFEVFHVSLGSAFYETQLRLVINIQTSFGLQSFDRLRTLFYSFTHKLLLEVVQQIILEISLLPH